MSIASGSSGNCIYIGSDKTHILIDAGISGKRIEAGLNSIGISGHDIDAIFVTHEHSDHINCLGVMARRYHTPIMATKGTMKTIKSGRCGRVDDDLLHLISADVPLNIKDIVINPLRISHDAAEPVAYRVGDGKTRIGIVTDLGIYDDYTISSMQDMDVLFLESNHDVRMLEAGNYPYFLKQRILSQHGHLSNETAGKLLCRLLHGGLKMVMLGHLSQENNLPELAYETVKVELEMGKSGFRIDDFPIKIAPRSMCSAVVEV
jgi:phosphoribosyl 1,2-cyclic phosphodiesterase